MQVQSICKYSLRGQFSMVGQDQEKNQTGELHFRYCSYTTFTIRIKRSNSPPSQQWSLKVNVGIKNLGEYPNRWRHFFEKFNAVGTRNMLNFYWFCNGFWQCLLKTQDPYFVQGKNAMCVGMMLKYALLALWLYASIIFD